MSHITSWPPVSDRFAVPADAVEILNAVLRLGQAQNPGGLVAASAGA